MPLLGMLAFSTVFALPFFVLALCAAMVSQLPRAGGWMNSVKVAMGFLEVAAAMKFLSNVDLVWKWGIFTRPSCWRLDCRRRSSGALFLGKFQLFARHETGKNRRVSACFGDYQSGNQFLSFDRTFRREIRRARIVSAAGFENSSARFFNNSKSEELKWIENDLDKALKQAKAENKRVFVDFTGYTCTNCRWMEANVFPKKEVEAELKKFVWRNFTPTAKAKFTSASSSFRKKLSNRRAAVLRVLDADGKTVSTFPGLTRNVPEFVDFLRKAQKI
jgi:thiol:disulfide interchange protein